MKTKNLMNGVLISGDSSKDVQWFPGGPFVSQVLPLPTKDNTRGPWGAKDCGGKCSELCIGHYSSELHRFDSTENPPSVIPSLYLSKNSADTDLELAAKRCMLSTDSVKIWMDHLRQVCENRKRGVEKARKTREANKAKKL